MKEACPSEEQIAAYAEGSLDPAARAEIERHLDGCDVCREVVALLLNAAGPSPATEARAKETLARGTEVGRYLVLSSLGAGGMGVVYEAFDPTLERKVALKLLRPERQEGEAAQDARTRLLREAQAMARLSHPNVVAVYDFGTFGEQIFVAMEYVRGPTLRSWLTETERDWRAILSMFVDTGEGLAAAHAAGLVHRDFKPENVLVDGEGRPRVGDFGLALALGEDGAENSGVRLARVSSKELSGSLSSTPSITKTGAVMGTPAYMSPEQLSGQPADARSDQFSFCVALWEALYGVRPFTGATMRELLAALSAGPASPPKPSRVPPRVRRVLLRGLSAAPSERYEHLGALLDELKQILRARTRRLMLEVAALAVVALLAVTASVRRTEAPPCPDASAQLAGVWDAQVKQAIDGRAKDFDPAARDALARAETALDGYASAWRTATNDSCVRARVRHEVPDSVYALRSACFELRRRDLAALSDGLKSATAEQMDNAIVLASGLPALESCDTGAVQSIQGPRVAPPPEKAAEIAALRSELAHAEVVFGLQPDSESFRDEDKLVDRARLLGYAPLEAQALRLRGNMLDAARQYDDAIATFDLGARAAERGSDDETRLRILLDEATVRGTRQGRFEDAEILQARAEAILERLGAPRYLAAETMLRRGTLQWQELRTEEAATTLERALSLQRAMYGDTHPLVGRTFMSLAQVYKAGGRMPEARAASERGLEIIRARFGPANARTANALFSLGTVLLKMGEPAEAAQTFELAGQADPQKNDPSGRHLLEVRIAEAWAMAGDPAKARARLDPAFAWITANLKAEDLGLASAWFCRARVELAEGHARDAVKDLQTSLELSERIRGKESPLLVDGIVALSEAQQEAGDLDGAQASARRAVDLVTRGHVPAPVDADAQARLGEVLLERGDAAGALPPLELAWAWHDAHEANGPRRLMTELALVRAQLAAGKSGRTLESLQPEIAAAIARRTLDGERLSRAWARARQNGARVAGTR